MLALSTKLCSFIGSRRIEFFLAALVLWSCAYFFQGGGWNQNAHFATTVALVEHGTVHLDRYRHSTGDLARSGEHFVSAKPIGTALVAIPAYLLAHVLSWPNSNHGDRVILRAWFTSVLTSGLALTLFTLLLYKVLLRRLTQLDAALLAAAIALASPLWPNSTMLNSHALVALFALGAYAILEQTRLSGTPPSRLRLLLAGFLMTLPTAFEYMTAVLVLPLGLYALWQCRPRTAILWSMVGAIPALAIPLVHHTLVYGHPLAVGYANLTHAGFAQDAARGFMGFTHLSAWRMWQLSFGVSRGIFYLSPFLLAGLPGLVLLLRRRQTRPEGLVNGASAWLIMLLVASLTYWHSGSATGSRYALLFIVFSAVPVAAMLPRLRTLIALAAMLGFGLMTMATSVCAIPPSPGVPPYENVVLWWWTRFVRGDLAHYQFHVLHEQGLGAGAPRLAFAFNLGQLLELPGLLALLPWLVGLISCTLGILKAALPLFDNITTKPEGEEHERPNAHTAARDR